MTCIVGYLSDNRIYMGGDSAGVAGLNIRERSDEKVFIKGNMIFGFTSSFRMGQLIRYNLTIPKHRPDEKADYEYMCTDFIDAVISCFKNNGYARINSNEVDGGTFLVGYRNSLYKIESDFQVGRLADPYDACGCGEYYAMGAIKVYHENKNLIGLSDKDVVEETLKTVVKFSAGVRDPFTILSI